MAANEPRGSLSQLHVPPALLLDARPKPAPAPGVAVKGAAVAAMDREWALFPVQGKDRLGSRGVLDASRAFDLIESWWSDGTELGIALATRAPSDVWVLDDAEAMDSLGQICEALEALEVEG